MASFSIGKVEADRDMRYCTKFLSMLCADLEKRVQLLEHVVAEYRSCYVHLSTLSRDLPNRENTEKILPHSSNDVECKVQSNPVAELPGRKLSADIGASRASSDRKLKSQDDASKDIKKGISSGLRPRVSSGSRPVAAARQPKQPEAAAPEGELDRILRQARELRLREKKNVLALAPDATQEIQPKPGSIETQEVKSVLASGSVSAEGASQPAAEEKKPQQEKPRAPNAFEEANGKFIDVKQIEKAVASVYAVDKNVYMSQSRLLSKAAGRVKFPASATYESVKWMSSESEGHQYARGSSDPAADSACDVPSLMRAMKLRLQENKARYERLLRRSVKELGHGAIAGPEREDIFRIWYENQAIMEIYEALALARGTASSSLARDRVSADTWSQEYDSALATVTGLPVSAPISLSCSSEKLMDDDYFQHKMASVRAFNDALQSRAQFAAESVISRTLLRDAIRQLRQCSTVQNARVSRGTRSHVEETTTSDGASDELRRDWVESLKVFRSSWQCLAPDSTVSFMNK
jgi:hypothetical protein